MNSLITQRNTTIQKRSINWEEERNVCIKHPFHWVCFPSTSSTCLFSIRSYTSALLHFHYLQTREGTSCSNIF